MVLGTVRDVVIEKSPRMLNPNIIEAGYILLVIDKVFSFDQTKKALSYLEEGRAKGKVVVKVI